MKKILLPWEVWSKEDYARTRKQKTSVIYYGGKSNFADDIIAQFPIHSLFGDVFGGGGAVILSKHYSEADIYNDIGNVANFFRVLRDNVDELLRRLRCTPWSREEWQYARNNWERVMESDEVEWARLWYITLYQGYTHEEYADSWRVAKSVSMAQSWCNHIDNLYFIAEKFRKHIMIEHVDFAKFIELYGDDKNHLLYFDPPYMVDTRSSQNNYVHEMPVERHEELIELVNSMKAQAVVSMYHHPLYDNGFKHFRMVERTRKSAIHNSSSSLEGLSDRTEVLWIKEYSHGLWSSSNVS